MRRKGEVMEEAFVDVCVDTEVVARYSLYYRIAVSVKKLGMLVVLWYRRVSG